MGSVSDILPSGNYCTPERRCGWFARRFPSLAFYSQVAPIVLSVAWRSRKGCFDDADFQRASTAIVRVSEACGAQIQVRGSEHIAAVKRPCVLIGNHMSTAETFMLPAILMHHLKICFVVKKGLVEYPVFKHIMIHQRPVVVGRDNPREDLRTVLDSGSEALANGRSVIVFPQTTRTPDFDPTQFNSIGVKLARKAGAPVVPFALQTNAWGSGKWFKDVGPFRPEIPVRFAFGPAREVEGSGKSTQQDVIDFIRSHLAEWQ